MGSPAAWPWPGVQRVQLRGVRLTGETTRRRPTGRPHGAPEVPSGSRAAWLPAPAPEARRAVGHLLHGHPAAATRRALLGL